MKVHYLHPVYFQKKSSMIVSSQKMLDRIILILYLISYIRFEIYGSGDRSIKYIKSHLQAKKTANHCKRYWL